MKAFVIPQLGTHAVELAAVPVPKIDDDELLVRVHAVGVGIHDSYFLPGDAKYPYPIGIEAAGVIEQIGSDVSGYQPGDRVTFVSSMQPKGERGRSSLPSTRARSSSRFPMVWTFLKPLLYPSLETRF